MNPSAMTQESAHRTVAETLRNPTVVEFVRTSVKAGYREFFGAYSDDVCGMVTMPSTDFREVKAVGLIPASW